MSEILDQYLKDRIAGPDYRGTHLSQHNRIAAARVRTILDQISRFRANDRTILIPPGDDPYPTPGGGPPDPRLWDALGEPFHAYLDLVQAVRDAGEPSTFNSLKKNFLPDFARMGLVERSRVNGGGYELSITPLGERFASSQDRDLNVLFGDCILNLVKESAPGMVEKIDFLMKELDYVNLDELMFIVSDPTLDGSHSASLIRDLRQSKGLKRAKLFKDVREQCEATMTSPLSKSDMRDFGNWRNQAQQTIALLGYMPGFKLVASEPTILAWQTTPIEIDFTTTRSESVRREAREAHGVDREYDLHHIVPLAYAQSKPDLSNLDHYLNLIPLVPEVHHEIPTTGNTFIRLEWNEGLILLVDPLEPESRFEFRIGIDAFPAESLRERMLDFNDTLVQRFS